MTDIAFTHLAKIRVSRTATGIVVMCPNCKEPLHVERLHFVKTTCPTCGTAFMAAGALVAYTSGNPDELRPVLMEALELAIEVSEKRKNNAEIQSTRDTIK